MSQAVRQFTDAIAPGVLAWTMAVTYGMPIMSLIMWWAGVIR
jgi:hypothetical protein